MQNTQKRVMIPKVKSKMSDEIKKIDANGNLEFRRLRRILVA